MRAATQPSGPSIAADLVQAYDALKGPGNRLIARVAQAHRVTVAEIKGQGRTNRVAFPRMHAAYELRKMGKTFAEIGQLLGGRDHTTALHAVRVWPERAAKLGIPVDLETL